MSGVPPPSPQRPQFPSPDEYAREFFKEAVRHLEDAYLLHEAKRYPAAITSSLKAAELSIKAALILEGSLGWRGDLQQTHQPLMKIENHPVLKYHAEWLDQQRPGLKAGITTIEKLAPGKPGAGQLTREDQANTEYPFFYLQPSSPGDSVAAHLVGPSEHFTEPASLDHYRRAHELLTLYMDHHSKIKAWSLTLPSPL